MYRKILIALENSPTDDAALPHAANLARVCGAELLLAHVADGYGARYQGSLNLSDSEEMQRDQAYLDRRRQELESAGLSARAMLRTGPPAERLVELAESEGCDLIAMATHRHGAIADLVLGSVASSVRHRTQIPVLLVPAR
jgi:manganese transport protein